MMYELKTPKYEWLLTDKEKKIYQLTVIEQHLVLMKKLRIQFNETEVGAFGIDPKYCMGNFDLLQEIVEALNCGSYDGSISWNGKMFAYDYPLGSTHDKEKDIYIDCENADRIHYGESTDEFKQMLWHFTKFYYELGLVMKILFEFNCAEIGSVYQFTLPESEVIYGVSDLYNLFEITPVKL